MTFLLKAAVIFIILVGGTIAYGRMFMPPDITYEYEMANDKLEDVIQ